MSRRNRTAAARRRTAQDREQRRATLAVLLARVQRGVILPAEADRMVGIVTRELAHAETLRGQVNDRRREHAATLRQLQAAEAAIREAEQDRNETERKLRGYVAIFGPNAVEDWHTMQHRAKTAEAKLAAAELARREQADTIHRQRDTIRAQEQQLADVRKAYADVDAVATLRARQVDDADRRASMHADRADAASRVGVRYMADAERYEAAWRSAARRASARHEEIQRQCRLVTQLRQQRDDARETVTKGREVLRSTENDLGTARERLAQRANVQGDCPACHGTSLFLGDGGYVTCSRLDCPAPDAATDLLGRPLP